MSEEYKLTREMIDEETKKQHPDWEENRRKYTEEFKSYLENPDLMPDTDMKDWSEKQRRKLAIKRANISANDICTSHDAFMLYDEEVHK